jgi:uncharacterized protein (TIGR02145 family)
MKGAMNKILGAAAMAVLTVACSSSDDKDVAGGASGDMGIVANVITGDAQKGPFVKGSAVTVQGIDCKTLQLTDEHFEGEVKSDKGDFAVKDVSLKSTCALFEVTGLYRSEITGKTSSKELTLRALTDLKDRENVNINILTNLEYERLLHLVTEKGKSFADAKTQAEQEVLAAFDIAGSFEEFENLNIFEPGDGNAALLAVSVMMQAKTDDAGLAKRLDEFSESFAETGVWKDSTAKAVIEEWQVAATADGTLDSIRKNIEAWNIGDTVAAFEKYIGASSSSEMDKNSSSSRTDSSGSEYDAAANTLKDLRDDKVYKTVKIGDQVWMAENLNFETDSSFCYNDSAENCAKYGRLYTWTAATSACPDGWNLPSEADIEALIKAVGGEEGAGTKLKSTSGWSDKDGKSGNGTDAFGFSALPAGIGNPDYYGKGLNTYFWGSTECGSEGVPETGNGCANAMFLDYDDADVDLRSYAAKDLWLSVRCVMEDGGFVPASSSNEIATTSSSSPSSSSRDDNSSSSIADEKNSSSSASETVLNSYEKEAYLNPEIKYDSIVDSRDGQVYKTVKIGDQVWMAQNLNYADSAKTPSLLGRSWCYNDSSKNCEKYGRLYTWAAAMDSVETGCGYSESGTGCYRTTDVQGICPSDWHLPSFDEWKVLYVYAGEEYISGRTLKSKKGWKDDGNGFDDYGFSAIPAGEKDSYRFYDEGMHASFWSSSEFDWYASEEAYYLDLSYSNLHAEIPANVKYHARSIRCIKDGSASTLSSSSSGNSGDALNFDWSVSKESYLNPKISYDTFVDDRDGKTYKTVKIGKQVWMAENLNYADSVKTPSLKKQSWCYDDDEAHCDVAGRLYTWAAAVDSVALAMDKDNPQNCGSMGPCELPKKVQGICPNGWHLPSKDEWGIMLAESSENPLRANAKYFKSSIGWCGDEKGSDDFGFSALPAGYVTIFGFSVEDEHAYRNAGYTSYWWSADEDSGGLNGGVMSIQCIDKNAEVSDAAKVAGNPVRCVKD